MKAFMHIHCALTTVVDSCDDGADVSDDYDDALMIVLW